MISDAKRAQVRDVGASAVGRLELVMACDETYAMPLATALRSLVETNRRHWPIHLHILYHNFTDEVQHNVVESVPRGSVSICWTAVDLTLFQEFSSFLGYSKITYSRLLIPRIFPVSTSRLLYLDADVLILDDLGPLWETGLDDMPLGAVRDTLDEIKKTGESRVPEVLRLPQVRDYFNSGILLIDLDRWRADRISERAIEYLVKNPECQFPDQDALNVVCDGQWKPLDSRWNFQGHRDTCLWEVDREHRPAIVHFVTAKKPWDFRAANPNTGFFDSFRDRTRFARSANERLHDLMVGGVRIGWIRAKYGLRRYPVVRAAWSCVRPLMRNDAVARRHTVKRSECQPGGSN